MNTFIETLISNKKSEMLPEEYNYFEKLIGSWELDYIDHNISQSVKGEWHFSWVLEGMAIQDIIILPSRDTKKIHLILSLNTVLRYVSIIQVVMHGILLMLIQKNNATRSQKRKGYDCSYKS